MKHNMNAGIEVDSALGGRIWLEVGSGNSKMPLPIAGFLSPGSLKGKDMPAFLRQRLGQNVVRAYKYNEFSDEEKSLIKPTGLLEQPPDRFWTVLEITNKLKSVGLDHFRKLRKTDKTRKTDRDVLRRRVIRRIIQSLFLTEQIPSALTNIQVIKLFLYILGRPKSTNFGDCSVKIQKK